MRKQFLLPILSGGMNSINSQSNQIDAAESSYDRLVNRLLQKGLQPFDVGGCGDCFFRSVSHQYYDSPDVHIEIRQNTSKNILSCLWKVYLRIHGKCICKE